MDYDLYIQVRDGLPINHPAYKANLIDAFDNVPNDWEPFIRVDNPTNSDPNLVLEHPTPVYRKVDGVWKDVWYARPKNEQDFAAEKQARLNGIRDFWVNIPYANNFTAWVLNEETEKYEPPIPRPTDGKFYRWHGPSNNWREAEPFPQDGKKYTFDFDNWVNVEIV